MDEPDPLYQQVLGELFEASERGALPCEDELLARHPDRPEVVRRALADLLAYRRATEQLREQLAPPAPASLPGPADDARVTSESPPAGLPASSLEPVVRRLQSHAPQQTRYRRGEELGSGGMGVVYRVWDEDLRRNLAMKVARVPTADGEVRPLDPRMLARFLEEAQVTGQLDHPGIVPVHELGLDAAGRLYFTMKLVKGRTLKEVFDELARGEGDWSQTRVLGLVLKVCEAMSYAHDKGVIHRDLKPANVMVGRYGEVYVMDWGLARILGRAEARDLRIQPQQETSQSRVRSERHDLRGDTPDSPICTMDGDVVGSPAYMPPEQATGRVEELGPASDVYAVGTMLYHLLAGHMPYVPPGVKASNYMVVRWVQEGPPQPLADVAPQAPAELVAVCEKAMARRPADRYANMAALAEDLSAYLEGRVVTAYEVGAWAEARKWVRRNKALAAATAATLVALVAGIGGGAFAVQADEARRAAGEAQAARSLAEQARLDAESERAKVLGLSDVIRLQQLLGEVDALWPAHPERIPDLESWLERAQALASNLPSHRATLAEMRSRALPWSPADGETAERSLSPSGETLPRGSEPKLSWRFELPEDQWQHDALAELVHGLEDLEAGLLDEGAVTAEHGWSVPKRLAFARELEAGFAGGGQYARAWSVDLPEIRAAYPGLDLTPQMGLVPIGVDSASGLWEFLHLMSGDLPRRRANGEIVPGEDTGVILVLVPGGSTWVGAQRDDPAGRNHDPEAGSEEGPVHEVRLSPYFLSKYELTQGQWLRLTGRNPSRYGKGATWSTDFLSDGSLATLAHPVEQVSWSDCLAWLRRAGLALPTEAQWEHGARGGTSTAWWTGADKTSLAGAANLVDRYARTHGGASWSGHEMGLDDGATVHAPVGTYRPNPFGLHDVTGNLWEWCLDGYDKAFYARTPLADPLAPSSDDVSERVYRGGGFSYAAPLARSAARYSGAPTLRGISIGVRPARALER